MINIGERVEFILEGSDGQTHRTKDYEGKVLILYTYPKDNTPGCTTQACTFRDLDAEFKKLNAVVLGLNKDSINTHQNFRSKFELPFTLLSDPDLKLIQQLGATKDEGKVARNTYIIDEVGNLEKIYTSVSPKNNPEEVLEYIKSRQ